MPYHLTIGRLAVHGICQRPGPAVRHRPPRSSSSTAARPVLARSCPAASGPIPASAARGPPSGQVSCRTGGWRRCV